MSEIIKWKENHGKLFNVKFITEIDLNIFFSSPWRIIDDTGAAFAMGTIGSSIFHSIKAVRNSPKGFSKRFENAKLAVKTKSPITGGNFAMWGGLFSVVDCTMVYLRQKEDPWNSITSGFITGGLLQVRRTHSYFISFFYLI